MYIYIYIYIYRVLKSQKRSCTQCTSCTSCAQVHGLPQNHCGGNRGGHIVFMIVYIYIYIYITLLDTVKKFRGKRSFPNLVNSRISQFMFLEYPIEYQNVKIDNETKI